MSESEFNDYNEVIYERDKLKEQNEKLKEAALEVKRFADAYMKYGSNSVNLLKAMIAIDEALKSCES